MKSSPYLPRKEKGPHSSEDLAQPKIKTKKDKSSKNNYYYNRSSMNAKEKDVNCDIKT